MGRGRSVQDFGQSEVAWVLIAMSTGRRRRARAQAPVGVRLMKGKPRNVE